MSIVLEQSQCILLQLLKVALGNPSSKAIPADADWEAVVDTAFSQGVHGVAFDAVESMDNRPERYTLLGWLGKVNAMEMRYDSYKYVIGKLASVLNGAGLKMVILKGYGCSLNYPKPSRRPCGDIDIYVMTADGKHCLDTVKLADDVLVAELGARARHTSDHHSQLWLDKFMIEDHATILDVTSHKSSIYANSVLESLVKESEPSVVNDNIVWLPSTRFNAIHLLRHMANDFATVKTTLRQVLDWSTFVSHNDPDWGYIHETVGMMHMTEFLDAINSICVDYLGYSADRFPITKRDDALRDRVLKDIFSPEFSSEIPSMKDKFAYMSAKTRRLWANRWKYRIVYDESLLSSFVGLAKHRIKHLF